MDAARMEQQLLLEMYEDLISRHSKALDEVDGRIVESAATGDPDVDHIRLSALSRIRPFFEQRRESDMDRDRWRWN